jgi:LCP family protein required for cell wall assembly
MTSNKGNFSAIGTSPGPMRHAHRPAAHPVRAILKIAAVALVVTAISSTSVVAIAIAETASHIKAGVHLASTSDAPAAPGIGAAEGEVNVLLTGTDTRTGQGGAFSSAEQLAGSSGTGSNDVTMVMHIPKDHSSATVISIPRDLITPVPACPDPTGGNFSARSAAMFNTTLSEGGLPCVVLAAESLTGLNIAYAAMINFDGVIALSNAVGGVEVCLATPINDIYTNLHLAAGTQNIIGEDALAFVRTRHGVGDGSDLGRISNQQVFLSALLRKITSAGVLSDPVTLYTLANAAISNITPSDTLSNPISAVAIALALKNISLSNIVFLQYPVVSDPADPNRVVPDSRAVKTLDAALKAGEQVQLTGTVGVGAVAATPAPTTTPSASASATPTPVSTDPASATTIPTATPMPTDVALPSNVSGQTADAATCSKGNN